MSDKRTEDIYRQKVFRT